MVGGIIVDTAVCDPSCDPQCVFTHMLQHRAAGCTYEQLHLIDTYSSQATGCTECRVYSITAG